MLVQARYFHLSFMTSLWFALYISPLVDFLTLGKQKDIQETCSFILTFPLLSFKSKIMPPYTLVIGFF